MMARRCYKLENAVSLKDDQCFSLTQCPRLPAEYLLFSAALIGLKHAFDLFTVFIFMSLHIFSERNIEWAPRLLLNLSSFHVRSLCKSI